MSSTIITKNSSTASAVPLAGSLVQGELAVNVTDKKLYSKDNAGNVFLLASNSGVADAAASAVLASEWAIKPSTPVAGGEYSAKYHAIAAAASAASAASSAAALGLVRVARTSNTALTSSNKGNLIDITSGTFTQTFDACASLGNGWFCYIDNSGTGDITLDPNGSETIDGLTSFVMYPGEVRLIQCDGTTLRSIVLNVFSRTFTASGTFTKPPGYSSFEGLIWGAGGSGGKSNSNGGGGGGGGCTPFVLPNASVGASVTVTIAAASTGPSVNGNGVNGGNSTFGSLATGYGGAGGYFDGGSNTFGGGGGGVLGAAAQSSSGQGGQPSISPGVSNASVNVGFGGGNGSTSVGGAAVYGGAGGGGATAAGGSSLYGGGGGGGRNSGAAGASVYAGAGGAGASTLSGGDGTAPGGGGGGTDTGTKAGNGARGELRIWGII
jgi:hypothetical protein